MEVQNLSLRRENLSSRLRINIKMYLTSLFANKNTVGELLL